jgi:CDP-diacylglycerol---glycerol-3-phosphate 3-phosphatidyltransferase
MLSNLIEDWARGIARQVGRLVAKSRLSPNSLTIIGFLLNFPVAFILAQGHNWSWIAGGLLMLFAGAFDMLDGAVARVTGKSTKFGAFLDSNFDRLSEVVVFLGLLLYFRSGPNTDQYYGSVLVYIAITGSLMVSYTKARAEGLGMACKGVGLLPRPERVLIIAAGCIFTPMWDLALIVALWILAIGTNFTAAQRIGHIWIETNRQVKAEKLATLAATQAIAETNLSKDGHKDAAKEEEQALPRKGWRFRRVDGQ